jgi:hypothetical protein
LHDYGALGYHRKELVIIANFPKELQSSPIPLPLVGVDSLSVPSVGEIVLQYKEECTQRGLEKGGGPLTTLLAWNQG